MLRAWLHAAEQEMSAYGAGDNTLTAGTGSNTLNPKSRQVSVYVPAALQSSYWQLSLVAKSWPAAADSNLQWGGQPPKLSRLSWKRRGRYPAHC